MEQLTFEREMSKAESTIDSLFISCAQKTGYDIKYFRN